MVKFANYADVLDDEEFLIALGAVTAASAYLEFILRGVVLEFINGDGVQCVVADLTFANLHHLGNALGERLLKSDVKLRKFREMMIRAKESYEARNKLIHAAWRAHKKQKSRLESFRMRAKGSLRFLSDQWTHPEIRDVANRLMTSCNELAEFIQQKRFLNRSMIDEEAENGG